MNKDTVKEEKNERKPQKKSSQKVKSKTTTALDKLKEKTVQLEKEKKELQEKLLRTAAEFDNYKKRNERDRLQLIQTATEIVVTELLTIVDDMERSLEHMTEKSDFEAMKNGFELIYKNLMNILQKQGLTAMQAIGEQFDPEKHDALMQMEKENTESGTIIEEHKRGYLLNDKIIRHAQVIVAK